MSAAIHIVTTGFVPRDAITHHVIQEQRLVRAAGYRSEIFVPRGAIHPTMRDLAIPLDEWPKRVAANDAAIIHYSIANPELDCVLDHAGRLGLVYHNITPAAFLWDDAPILAGQCARGRRRLGELVTNIDATAADSAYNAAELIDLGFPEPVVVGLLRAPLPLVPRSSERAPGPLRLLFVGRGVPNKCQHDLILALAALRLGGQDATLELVGSWDGMETYRARCEALVAAFNLVPHVRFAGSISDKELGQAYAAADMFVCLSEHEGFCAPLLEAMRADLPIVAYAAAAVPETVGAAALVLNEKTPSVVAEAIRETQTNSRLQADMSQRRLSRLEYHSLDSVAQRHRQFLTDLTGNGDV